MAKKVNVGVRIPAIHPYDPGAVSEYVKEAEAQGFHSVWVGDHVFYRVDVPQPLTMLTWVAALTSRVRLGTAIMLTAYLNPVLLAKTAATLDYLSGGRLTLGISLGGTDAEYNSLGVPIKQRVSRLVENVEIVRKLWAEDDVTYEGRYNHIEGGRISPKPVQKPGVPLWFGAASEPSLRRTAQLADGWMASAAGGTEGFLAGAAQVQSFVREAGRDTASFGMGKLQSISVDRDPARARELAETQWKAYYGPNFDVDRGAIHGDPAACAAKLAEIATAEANELTLALETSTLDAGQLTLLKEATADLPGAW